MCALRRSREQGFEDLLQGHANLASDRDGGQVFGVDLVGAQFVRDSERVQQPSGVGLVHVR